MCDTLTGCLVLVGRSANHMNFSSTLTYLFILNSLKEVIWGKPDLCSGQEASPALRNVLKGAGLGCAGFTWASSICLQVRRLLVKICMPTVGWRKKKKGLCQVNLDQQPDAHWATFILFLTRTWGENRMKKLEEFKIRTITGRDALKKMGLWLRFVIVIPVCWGHYTCETCTAIKWPM